jgi:2-dehydropantoate 2-reductase
VDIAVVGAGAVGGYYGAKLAAAGHRVTFLARGANLKAIRERGLVVWSPLGDFTVHAAVEDDAERVGPVELVILAVKTYDNDSAIPMVARLTGPSTTVLTLQNGVDSPSEVAAMVGEEAVLGGAAYIATALSLPGLIEQTGTHRRIVFGEVFGKRGLSGRVCRISEALAGAGLEVEPVADARSPLWEKFVYLSVFAGFTGASRLPIGPLWASSETRELFMEAVEEVQRVAAAEGVDLAPEARSRIKSYVDALPAATRSSLLIDLQMGKPIEVEALLGSVVRRGRAAAVSTPIMSTLYSVLRPHAQGDFSGRRQ